MRLIDSQLKKQSFWLVPVIVWTQVVAASAWWSIHSNGARSAEMAAQRGRDLFQMIELTREWNANHGGVFAIRSEKAPPNPYLKTPNRDLTTTNGLKLTMIDPAYMARQISDIARLRDFYFHLTSDNPLRPANAPDAWERRALESFEQGATEQIELIENNTGAEYRYMAPLKVEAPCLGCHAVQGYQLGDIRGGISVNIGADRILAHSDKALIRIGAAHAAVWLAVTAIIFLITRNTRRGVQRLANAHRSQAQAIAKKDRALKAAQTKLRNLRRKDPLTGFYNRKFFEKALQEALDKAEARDQSFGLLVLELDYFKEYNDSYGILEGDIVIRMIAEVLGKLASYDDILFGRYIGSSLAIAVPDSKARHLEGFGEDIRNAVYELGIKHEYSEAAKFVTVTVGVAHLDAGQVLPAQGLIKQAALAMFKGKQRGRNCVVAA